MSPLETQILQQISALQSTMGGNSPSLQPQQMVAPQPSPVQTMSGLSEEDVKRIAKQVLMDELSALKDSIPIPAPPVQTQEPQQQQEQEVSPTLMAVGKALTEDERAWLLQPDKLAAVEATIPAFLNSDDGLLAIQSFYLYFRGLYDKQND